jgi:hypothetical protein
VTVYGARKLMTALEEFLEDETNGFNATMAALFSAEAYPGVRAWQSWDYAPQKAQAFPYCSRVVQSMGAQTANNSRLYVYSVDLDFLLLQKDFGQVRGGTNGAAWAYSDTLQEMINRRQNDAWGSTLNNGGSTLPGRVRDAELASVTFGRERTMIDQGNAVVSCTLAIAVAKEF